MKRKSKSIFASLVRKYIAFVFIVILSLLLTAVFIAFQISSSADSGQAPKLTSIEVVRSDYENIDSGDIIEAGGWVEILDENMSVIYFKGNKQDDKLHYSQQEMYNILNMDSHNKYLGIMQGFKANDGRNLYCLVKYPSDTFTLQLNMKKASFQTGSIIYNNFIKGAVFFLLLSVGSIMLFSKWTSKKINRPLVEITRGLTKMAEGDYTAKIDFKAEKEFAVIRASFNIMVEKLKAAEEEKSRVYQDRTRMLMDLSHDIKTPISTILGFSRALSEGLVQGEEKRQRYYSSIYTKGLRVSELVDDLFEFVKLESSDYKLLLNEVDFCEFVRKTTAEFYDEMEEKKFETEIIIPDKEIILSIDERLMNRAVSNLLSNAVKYNPEGTHLRIEISETPSEVTLEVGDNGTGIPSHIRDYIFNPFVRGDESRKSDGGTGLGLAISKKIVEKHGGVLSLSNEVKEEKTTFKISMYNN